MTRLSAVWLCLGLVACECRGRPASTAPSAEPSPSSVARAFVSTWGGRACAGDGRGEARCFGPEPAAALAEDAIHIALGGAGACVVRRSGEVLCMRAGDLRATGVSDGAQVAVGAEHACALRRGGTIACWGDNDRGQLGDGTTEPRRAPVAVASIDDAREVAAGAAHTCALRADGSVWCWGGHPSSEDIGASPRTPEELLAAAARQPRPIVRPRKVQGIEPAADVAASDIASCALGEDRRVSCWPPYLGAHARPTAFPWPGDAVALAIGPFGGCVARERGGVACWDPTREREGARTRAVMPIAVRGAHDAVDVAVGDERACARLRAGGVACWDARGDVVVLGSRGDSR